jgi:hypothetical protein
MAFGFDLGFVGPDPEIPAWAKMTEKVLKNAKNAKTAQKTIRFLAGVSSKLGLSG